MNNRQYNSMARCSAIFATLVVLGSSVSAGQFVRVSPDLELYYEETGSGPTMIFIPGWTLTTEFFSQQHAHFSKRYRTISYDPRGQGRSSKTLENNHYTQHGADLKAFMDALKLQAVILIAHSYGCFDAYAYFRAFGTANARAFICIDESPKPTVVKEGDWGIYTTFEAMRSFNNDIIYRRREVMPKFAQSMVTRKLSGEEVGWFVEQVME
ncbi:MAG: alpha/beta fold hydrolase, partial [Pyrinomonadaceae bacterium]